MINTKNYKIGGKGKIYKHIFLARSTSTLTILDAEGNTHVNKTLDLDNEFLIFDPGMPLSFYIADKKSERLSLWNIVLKIKKEKKKLNQTNGDKNNKKKSQVLSVPIFEINEASIKNTDNPKDTREFFKDKVDYIHSFKSESKGWFLIISSNIFYIVNQRFRIVHKIESEIPSPKNNRVMPNIQSLEFIYPMLFISI